MPSLSGRNLGTRGVNSSGGRWLHISHLLDLQMGAPVCVKMSDSDNNISIGSLPVYKCGITILPSFRDDFTFRPLSLPRVSESWARISLLANIAVEVVIR